jgi:hypothetical protein
MHKAQKITLPTALDAFVIGLAGQFPTAFIVVAVAVNSAWLAAILWMR